MRGIAVPFLLAGVWACVDPPSDGADPDPPAPAETTTEDAALAAGLDSVVTALLATHDIPGASLAIARDGRVVLAKGYGWADTTARIPTRPEHRFRIASVSKPVTAIAILTLIERGRLALDDRPFSFLGTVPSGGGPPDPRIGEITVADLLRHRAGFDRTRGLDPTLTPGAVAQALGVDPPVTVEQVVGFMLDRPLDFAGTPAICRERPPCS